MGSEKEFIGVCEECERLFPAGEELDDGKWGHKCKAKKYKEEHRCESYIKKYYPAQFSPPERQLKKYMNESVDEVAKREWIKLNVGTPAQERVGLDEKKISRIIELNIQDGDNFPSAKALADATAHTICQTFTTPQKVDIKYPKELKTHDKGTTICGCTTCFGNRRWNHCIKAMRSLNNTTQGEGKANA